ncbi:MAG: hypothetical protein FJW96_08505 [Actinobacteria bacterium]|nr:hypothetical protein [Actinomycetota bacterium]
MGLLDRIREGSYVPDDDGLAPRQRVDRSSSLAETARRIAADGNVMIPVRDFLDQVSRLADADLERLIEEEPPPTGAPEADALLAGIAEHLAATRSLRCPRWVLDESRFLERFWFVSNVQGFRAIAIAQTPIALKRRGVFWPERSMARV